MGTSASAGIVYGVHLGGIEGDDEGSVVGALTMLGVECDFDTVDSDLEAYAKAAGLSHIAVGSWDYGGRIICASATLLDDYDWGSLPFDALPEVEPVEVERLKAIGKKLGREPGWHLVAFYG